MSLFLKHACDRVCVIRSLRISAIVSAILALINHTDAVISGTFDNTNLIQMKLTYLVPFCVSTFGSATKARHIELQNRTYQEGNKNHNRG